MIAGAAKGDFDWLYGLRILACAGALWHYRSQYTSLDWRMDWTGPAAGVAVFVIWIAMEQGTGGAAGAAMPWALANSSTGIQAAWIAMRVLAAVITVPIAEELAFRGFAIRRLMRTDFETLPAQSFTWWAVVISSLGFGFLHGDRWLAGIVAGLLYAAVYLRRGRIGDAVAAHAVTNALLAAYVLAFQRWQLW